MLAQILSGDWLENTKLDTQEVNSLTNFLNGRRLLFTDDMFASASIIADFPSIILKLLLNMELNIPKTKKKK
jgi:hypothetical protein